MNVKNFCLIVFFILFTSTSYSQGLIRQKINGLILDKNSKAPVEGVNVLIKGQDFEKGTSSDIKGKFAITDIPVGRYNIFFSHVGYKPFLLKDHLVESGKELNVEVELESAVQQLSEVSVLSSGDYASPADRLSSYSFSQEQSQRFAATFYDPGRMALSFPGITSSNDQANNIAVRGNPPYTNKWFVEGIEIVNPNHLTNAGTFTDRISIVGGGVNILSAQLMSDVSFLTGAYPPAYGDALGGIFDIGLRKGNPSQREHVLQGGLLGIDIATEGPFGNNSQSSYLVNYRYSTIGLLQALGVEVSDETINFQDLSFTVSLPGNKTGDWFLFGILGFSSEKFGAEKDSSVWESEESRIDTDFFSNMGAVGFSNKLSLGSRTTLTTVSAISQLRTDREAAFLDDNYTAIPYQKDHYDHGLFSINSTVHHKLSNGSGLSGGLIFNRTFFDLLSQEKPELQDDFTTFARSNAGYASVKAFAEWSTNIGSKISSKLGFHGLYFDMNGSYSLEPRIQIGYYPSERSSFSASYGLVTQAHFPQVYFVQLTDGSYPNEDLDLAKSHQFNVGYSFDLDPFTRIKLESYYQKHVRVPVSNDPSSTFSLLNAVDILIDQALVNKGEGENKGLELFINRSFKNGLYFITSAAVFDSKYSALDGIKRSTRYDGDYAINFTGGKEFQRLNKGKNRVFGVNVRVFWQGGYRHTPVDVAASAAEGKTIFIESSAFSEKYKDYFRTDLRLYFKRNKPGYTRTLSFDIQNLTGRKNIGYEYYDVFLDKVVVKEQLGLLPFISYRVEF